MYRENDSKTLTVASVSLQGPEAPSTLTVVFMKKHLQGPAAPTPARGPFHPPGAQGLAWQFPSSPFIKVRAFLAFFF